MSLSAFRAALLAAVVVLPATAFAQGAAPAAIPAVGATMDPPGTAELRAQLAQAPKPAAKPKTARKKPAAPKTVALESAAEQTLDHQAKKLAVPANAKLATAGAPEAIAVAAPAEVKPAAAKPAAQAKKKVAVAKPVDAVEKKPLPAAKKVKGKKGAPAAVAAPAPIDPAAIAAPEGGKLSGKAAWDRLVGNSINGMYEGSALVEAYLADNTVKTKQGGETKIGRWGFVDGRACFQYPTDQQASCYDVTVEGDQAAYADEDGQVFTFTINPGIPGGM